MTKSSHLQVKELYATNSKSQNVKEHKICVLHLFLPQYSTHFCPIQIILDLFFSNLNVHCQPTVVDFIRESCFLFESLSISENAWEVKSLSLHNRESAKTSVAFVGRICSSDSCLVISSFTALCLTFLAI